MKIIDFFLLLNDSENISLMSMYSTYIVKGIIFMYFSWKYLFCLYIKLLHGYSLDETKYWVNR